MRIIVFRLTILSFVLFLAVTSEVFAEIKPNTNLSKVIVYSQNAIIKREIRFKAQTGENILEIFDLPADLVDESVYLSTGEVKGIKILDVKIEKTHLKKITQQKIKELERKLEDLEEAVTKNEDELDAIKTSIEFLKKSTPFSENFKTTEAEVESFSRYIENALKERLDRASKLGKILKKLIEEKKAIEKELSQLRSPKDFTKIVIIVLSSDISKEITFELYYMVENASWRPRYELRVDSKSKKIEFIYLAEITQNTQEDWENVSLEISTAKPHYGALPEPKPWYLDVYMPRAPVIYKSMEMEKEVSVEGFLEEKGIKVKEELSSFTFTLPQKINIPSDGKPHSVVITSATEEVLLNYSTIPKLSSYVHLSGIFKNPFPYPITSGIANIYIDTRFVNKVSFKKQMLPGDEINLSFGIDESVKVERKLLKRFTEYTGVLSKGKRINYEYEIKITNGKKTEINLNLKDQFPVSRNEKIKVIRELPKEGEAKIGEDGIINWELKLNPGEKKIFKVKFSVEAPRDLEIRGLE